MDVRSTAEIEARKIIANLMKQSNLPGPGVMLPPYKFYLYNLEEFKRWGQSTLPAFPVVIEMPDGKVPTTEFKVQLLTIINDELNLLSQQEMASRLEKAKEKGYRYLLFSLLDDLYVSL